MWYKKGIKGEYYLIVLFLSPTVSLAHNHNVIVLCFIVKQEAEKTESTLMNIISNYNILLYLGFDGRPLPTIQ